VGTRPGLPFVLALALASPGARGQEATNRDQSGYTQLRPEGFPIRPRPAVVAAASATLRDDEIVIGVAVAGEARAYPVNLMWEPSNEVLNDELGGVPIAATWCPIAHSAAVFERRLDGGTADLGAVGLDRGVFVLYDTRTRTWWSQVAGRAPLEGRRLAARASTLTTWGAWRRLHPATTVFVDPARSPRRRFTEESWSRITLGGPGPVVSEDLVVGAEGPRGARAWLLRRLATLRVVNDELDGEPLAVLLAADMVTARVVSRRVGGRTLTLSAEGEGLRDAQTGSVWDPLSGRSVDGALRGSELEPRVFTYALWYAWRSQRPHTTLWGDEEGGR
jgi:hypothetical protein